jgi:hypothetical protein
MRMIDLDLRPSRVRLRQFGWAGTVAFALLAMSAMLRGHVLFWELGEGARDAAVALASLSAGCLLLSFVWPRGLWPLYVLLTLVALPVGTVLSYTLLALFFYGLLTPVGLWFRLRRRDLLDRRGAGGRDSYWRAVRSDREAQSYFRQF